MKAEPTIEDLKNGDRIIFREGSEHIPHVAIFGGISPRGKYAVVVINDEDKAVKVDDFHLLEVLPEITRPAPENVIRDFMGKEGPTGPAGPKGDKGDKGDPGEKGDKGDAANPDH